MHDNVACGGANVDQFYNEIGVAQAPPASAIVPELGFGVWINPATGFICGYIPNMGTHHCDGTSYYDETLTLIAPTEEARVAVSIHESVHGLQEEQSLGIANATVAGNDAAVFPLEQQADCGTGLFYAIGERNGSKTVAQVAEARALFYSVGVEGEHSHGSGSERVAAFDNGYHGGPAACNAYTPGVTVFPGS